jgi:hypothetical protein
MNFHFVFLVTGLATIAGTLISLRREHIRPEYSMSWLAVGALLSGLALFPGPVDTLSDELGINPQVCFLIIGGILVSALVFEISRVVSRLRDENTLMAQRVAILEFWMERHPDERDDLKSK